MFILLVCSGGMSTSLLVSKMKKEAEKQGKQYKILATSADSAYKYYDSADVILLGPQVGIYKDEFVRDFKKPVDIINRTDYGTMRGDRVLKEAEKLFENSR